MTVTDIIKTQIFDYESFILVDNTTSDIIAFFRFDEILKNPCEYGDLKVEHIQYDGTMKCVKLFCTVVEPLNYVYESNLRFKVLKDFLDIMLQSKCIKLLDLDEIVLYYGCDFLEAIKFRNCEVWRYEFNIYNGISVVYLKRE